MIVSTRRIWRSNLFTFPSGFSREALHIVALRRQNRAHGYVFRIWSSSNKACITRSCFVPLQQNCVFCEVSFRTCSLTLNTRKGHSGQRWHRATVIDTFVPCRLKQCQQGITNRDNCFEVGFFHSHAGKTPSSNSLPNLGIRMFARKKPDAPSHSRCKERDYVCLCYVLPRFWPAWNFGSPYNLPPARRLFAREQHCAINKHEGQWWRSNST